MIILYVLVFANFAYLLSLYIYPGVNSCWKDYFYSNMFQSLCEGGLIGWKSFSDLLWNIGTLTEKNT